MRTLYPLTVFALALFFMGGCASDGSFTNPFASGEESPPPAFFLSEFSDIPIPAELSESRSDTFITFAPSGIKCGTQRFTGRVEVVSLMNTLRRYMSDNGWILRSLLRAKESSLVFEKSDRFATFQVTDGLVTTELRLFVSSRLEGDAGDPAVNAFVPPSSSSSGGAQQLQR
jgi:hypothetical protein